MTEETEAKPLDLPPGRAKYAEARKLQHHAIPDSDRDGEYLKLLGESAELEYPRALAKFGEYAMRRGTLVEAYYWMWRSRQAGGTGLERVLCDIRKHWVAEGYPSEASNVHDHFTLEQGSIGRALLGIDAKHNAFAAKQYLKANHPKFLNTVTTGVEI